MTDSVVAASNRSRRIVLLIPARDLASVLAHERQLPVVDCELADGESTIQGAARMLPKLGLIGPILDCVVDQTSEAELGPLPRSALVELGPQPDAWTVPQEWDWLPWTELVVAAASGLRAKTRARIAEISGIRRVSAKRAAWTQAGWYEHARAWIDQSLETAGRALPDSVVQIRHCGISAVMRCDSVDGRTWFKASFPPFHREASISKALSELAPGATCGVVAADASQGWLLLDDLHGELEATDEQTTKRAIDALVSLQSNMLAHQEELLAGGCQSRPLSSLAAEFGAALDSEAARSQLGVSSERVDHLRRAVAQAAARIDASGLPETLVHGDFHPGNVASTEDSIVLFDWSDGAIASPVVEFVTWAWWFAGDTHRENELWALFRSAWKREFDIEITDGHRGDADVVAGAYHLVSYAVLLSGLDPVDQAEYIEGLDHFYEVLTTGLSDATLTSPR